MKKLLIIVVTVMTITAQAQVRIEDIGKEADPRKYLQLEYRGYKNYYWTNEYGEKKRIVADTIYPVPDTKYLIAKVDTGLYVLGFSMYGQVANSSQREQYKQPFQRQIKDTETLYVMLQKLWKEKEDFNKKHHQRH